MHFNSFLLSYMLPLLTTASPLPSNASTTITPSYPLPLPCTGEGCTITTYSIQDSSIITHKNGTLFRFSKSTSPGTGLTLSTASSLSGPWIRRPNVLVPTSPTVHLLDPLAAANPSNVSQWAPEVHHINGTYYLYYTVDNSNQSPYLDVAVASSPDMSSDSWTDHGSIAMPEPGSGSGTGWANIDLNVLVAFAKRPSARVSSGSVAKSRHVVWGSYNTGLYGAKLSPSSPLTLTAGTIPQLLIADQPTPIYPSGIANRTEASFHFKRGSWIYYIYSRGSCCAYAAAAVKGTEYVTEVCRASSPAGPFLDKAGRDCRDAGRGTGTVLLESHTQDSSGNWQVFGPGSVGVVNTPQGLVLTYQYLNQSAPTPVDLTMWFGHNYLAFDSQAWPYLAGGPTA